MKHHIALLLICMIGYASPAIAQNKVYYFDDDYELTHRKRNAIRYRIIEDVDSNIALVKDYYMSGKLYAENTYLTQDRRILNSAAAELFKHGYSKRYSEEGIVIKEGSYLYGQPTGIIKRYYPSGKIKSKYAYDNGYPEDVWVRYDEQGIPKDIHSFKNGKRDGLWENYHCNGNLAMHAMYKDGTPIGIVKEYSEGGDLIRSIDYSDDSVLRQIFYHEDGCIDTIASTSDDKDQEYSTNNFKPAIAPFGLFTYLRENYQYPMEIYEDSASGIVNISFTIDEEGDVRDVYSNSPEVNIYLQMEAVMLIASMPRWKPALRNGEPVESYLHIPIYFNWHERMISRIYIFNY